MAVVVATSTSVVSGGGVIFQCFHTVGVCALPHGQRHPCFDADATRFILSVDIKVVTGLVA